MFGYNVYCTFCIWHLNNGTHGTVHVSAIHAICPSLLGPTCTFCGIITTFQPLCIVHVSTFICVTVCPSLLGPMCALFSLVLKLFDTMFSIFSFQQNKWYPNRPLYENKLSLSLHIMTLINDKSS